MSKAINETLQALDKDERDYLDSMIRIDAQLEMLDIFIEIISEPEITASESAILQQFKEVRQRQKDEKHRLETRYKTEILPLKKRVQAQMTRIGNSISNSPKSRR